MSQKWQKRIDKTEDNHLHDNEKVVATLALQVKGAVNRAAVAGGLGGGIAGGVTGSTAAMTGGAVMSGARSMGKNKGKTYGGSSLAGKLPVAPLLFVLTDQNRILVYSWKPVSLQLTYQTEYKRTDLKRVDVKWGLLTRKATLTFADGYELPFDLPKLQDYKTFCGLING